MLGNRSIFQDIFSSKPLLLALAGATILPVVAAAAPPPPTGSTEFHNIWARTDYPVVTSKVARSWVWGPGPNQTLVEPNRESPGGQREVEYYDKSRMEII